MTLTPLRPNWTHGPEHRPPDGSLGELILAQAVRTPDAPAIRQWDTTLTYAELVARATDLAARLAGLGVGPETRVGLCARRTPLMPVAVLGVLLAGGAYVPLDPGHPRGRLEEVLDDAGIAVVVVDGAGAELLGGCDRVLIGIDAAGGGDIGAGDVEAGDAEIGDAEIGDAEIGAAGAGEAGIGAAGVESAGPVRPAGPAAAGNAAYVLYTSGSTGRPKGVVVSHRSVVAFTTATVAHFGLDGSCRSIAFSALGFDVSVLDMLAPLTAGGCVQLVPDGDRVDPARLQRFLEEHEVTWGSSPGAPAARRSRPAAAPAGPRDGGRAARARAGGPVVGARALPQLVRPDRVDGVRGRRRVRRRVAAAAADRAAVARLPGAHPGRGDERVPARGPGRAVHRRAAGRPRLPGPPALTAERFVPDPFSAEPGRGCTGPATTWRGRTTAASRSWAGWTVR
nr:hypothetical protein GCM10020093_018180 [Planobispora longispora]